jgi:drug/metabolite transporter (DMT)-like permease
VASVPRGIALMCGAALSMVGLDVTAKLLLETYGLSQLVFLRCGFSMLFIGWYALQTSGRRGLVTRQPGWHLLRTGLMAASMFAFFYALPLIPLAMLLTIAFAAPLVVTALSRPFLGEAVGPWRWGAVLVGFAGVLVVLQPQTGLGNPAAWIALIGAVTYALLSLSARKLNATESTAALSLYLFPAPLLIGAAGAWSSWQAPGLLHWLMFVACGAFGGLAFVLMNAAFRHANAAVLVPFDYTGLVWASLAGFVIWSEVPAPSTWLGAAIIIASGLFILYRETRLHRAEPQADFPLQEAVVGRVDMGSEPKSG